MNWFTQRVRFSVVVMLAIGSLSADEPKEKKPKEGRVPLPQMTTNVEVFGVEAKGTRFVYVFDRSASMSSFRGRPLAAAKKELIDSLKALKGTHQFQVIFFNESPAIYSSRPGSPFRLESASEPNKEDAAKFVANIKAGGGTDRVPALLAALSLSPDVIYFLTDAERPKLDDSELQRISRKNGSGAIIHCIEFGEKEAAADDNFLKRLAKQNRGKHVYVDVTKLRSE